MDNLLSTNFFILISKFSSPYNYPIIIIAIYSYRRDKSQLKDLICLFILTTLLNIGLKNLFHLPRPFIVNPKLLNLSNAHGYSFPSGNSQFIAAYMTYFIYRYKNISSTIIGIFLIVLVGLSRVLLNAHFPVDVIIGSISGISTTILYIYFCYKKSNSN